MRRVPAAAAPLRHRYCTVHHFVAERHLFQRWLRRHREVPRADGSQASRHPFGEIPKSPVSWENVQSGRGPEIGRMHNRRPCHSDRTSPSRLPDLDLGRWLVVRNSHTTLGVRSGGDRAWTWAWGTLRRHRRRGSRHTGPCNVRGVVTPPPPGEPGTHSTCPNQRLPRRPRPRQPLLKPRSVLVPGAASPPGPASLSRSCTRTAARPVRSRPAAHTAGCRRRSHPRTGRR
jgi:hypothetical protein